MRDSQRSVWLGLGMLIILLAMTVALVLNAAQTLRLRRLLKTGQNYRLDCGVLPLRQGGERRIAVVIAEYVPANRMLLVLRSPSVQLRGTRDVFAEITDRQRDLGSLAGTIRVLDAQGQTDQESALGIRHSLADRKSNGVVLAALPSLAKGKYQLVIDIKASAPAALQAGDCELLYDISELEYLSLYKRYARTAIFALLTIFFCRLLVIQLLSSRRQRLQEKWLADGVGCDKIIYLLTSYPLWSETFLRQDLRLLLAAGVPLEPLALFPGDAECQPGWPSVRVLSASQPDAVAGGHSSRWWLPGVVRAWLSLFRHRHLLRQLQAEIHSQHARHIHAEFADLGALLAAVAARCCGINFSLGIHARDVHANKYPLKMLCRDVSFVSTCNRAAGAALVKRLPDIAGKMHLIYHGLELAAWPFQEQEPIDAPLLFVGRFMPKKGLPILLRALALLQASGERCELVVLGSGPAEEEFKALAESLGLAEKVRWLGVLPREQVAVQLAKVEAICVPSVVARDGDREGIPNVVVEAMASGVPVVAGKSGGIAEILTAETGWPVDEVTPEALLTAIRALRRDDAERDQRRRKARQQVEANFDALALVRKRKNLFRR